MGDTKKPNRKLQHEREKRGFSQAYVAEKIGTIEKTVSRWECGEQIPSPKYRRRLCKLFGKDAVELGFLEEGVEEEISEESAASNSSPTSSVPSSGQGNSNVSLQGIASPTTSISVPEGAAIFVVHNGTTTLVQTPTSPSQIDVPKSNSAYSVEAVSPPQSPETPMMQGTESEDAVNRREAGKKIVSIGHSHLNTQERACLLQHASDVRLQATWLTWGVSICYWQSLLLWLVR
jgi:transcriptional regulator with XRE-family HTH domain